MGFILYLRNKKWFVKGFLFLVIILFIAILIPSVYETYQSRPGYVATIYGKNLSKEHYQQCLREIERKTSFKPSELHKLAWRKAVEEMVINHLCDQAGLMILSQDVEKAIIGYTSAVQEAVKEIDSDLYQKLLQSRKSKASFLSFIKTDQGKNWMQARQFKKSVQAQIKKQKIASMLHTKVDQGFFEGTDEIDVTYFRIPFNELDDIKLSDKEIKSHGFSEKTHPEAKNIAYTTFYYGSPSYREVHDAENEMKDLKMKLKDSPDPEHFAREHTDHSDGIVEEWPLQESPLYLKKLKVGSISQIISIDPYTLAIYKVLEQREKSFFTRDIVLKTCKIVKKISCSDNQEYIQKHLEELTKYAQNQSWDQIMKKKGYLIEKIEVTQAMANQIQDPQLSCMIAHKVFKNNLCPRDDFIIKDEKRKRYIVGWVQPVLVNSPSENCRKKITQKKQVKTLKEKISHLKQKHGTWKEIYAQLSKLYGKIDLKEQTNITLAQDRLSDHDCITDMHILHTLEVGEFHLFQDGENVLVAIVTNKRPLSTKQKISLPTIKGRELLDQHIDYMIKNNLYIQDYRYQFY